ncbi:MAG: ThiF family adenylyltransferase [Flavipsychrobacter sp.]
MQDDLRRYSCQIALPGFSELGQRRLQQGSVLIVGMGGLGCPAAQYLVAAGIGTLGIVDDDVISVTNLHRQILYTSNDIGQPKVLIAKQRLREQNGQVNIIPYIERLTSGNALSIISDYDIVIDATDNIETKYLLNDACCLTGKPLVYGAIYQYEGQLAVWNVLNDDGSHSPNYRDLFPDINASQLPNCADGGVIPTLAGIIGCMQANEVIKYLTRTGEILAGKLLIFDARILQSRIIKLGNTTKINIHALIPTTNVSTIVPLELKKYLEKNLYQLIDVRTKEEHELFNLGGNNIPLAVLELNINALSTDRPIILYCSSGKRSAEAVKLINKIAPHYKVLSLEGGINAWQLL